MYPFYFGPAAGFATPDKDDIGMFSTLYPAATFFATTGHDHRAHPGLERHDAEERLQRDRAQHRQSVRGRGVVDFRAT